MTLKEAIEARKILVAYLLLKVKQGDHHGTADAACDLRVLEAEHPELIGIEIKVGVL